MTIPQAYSDAQVVVPSDTVPLKTALSIYVGGAGNVTVITEAEYVRQFNNTRPATGSASAATIMAACTAITFTAPPVGSVLPIRVYAVKATLTTATLLLALLQ